MVTKKEFSTHMNELYDEDFSVNDLLDLYKTFKSIIKTTDTKQIRELEDITKMNTQQRLLYRYALATNGKEFTPRQVDQYISMIEFALLNRE
jgi:uncharacterized protein YktA (UPF0223 family)